MEIQFKELSIVILASDHNPTILNPDFLARTKIVDERMDWRVLGQSITTPAFSSVEYDSKVSINIDPMKLQVTDVSEDIQPNTVSEIVTKYVNVLEYVQYQALGINFTNIIKVDDKDIVNYLIERFIKDGGWNDPDTPICNLGLKFTYKIDDIDITFSIDKGLSKEDGGQIIISRANFHRNLNQNGTRSEQIKKYLENMDSDLLLFNKLQNKVIN